MQLLPPHLLVRLHGPQELVVHHLGDHHRRRPRQPVRQGRRQPVNGLNYGLEFKEGTRITVAFEKPPSLADVRAAVADAGYPDARSSRRPTSPAAASRLPDPDADARRRQQEQALKATLDEAFTIADGDGTACVSLETVGATFGRQVVSSSSRRSALALLLILVYVTFRFQWKFAVGAIAAEVHDLLMVVGIYSLTGREVTTATIAAVLTILGYSLYDTVIVFDRIRENEPQAAPHALRRHGQRVHLGDADAVDQHHVDRRCCRSCACSSSAAPRSRTSPSRCWSASSRAPTRRSSSPAPSSRCSRSASRRTASSPRALAEPRLGALRRRRRRRRRGTLGRRGSSADCCSSLVAPAEATLSRT